MFSACVNTYIDFFKAFLTPLIGAIVSYIAWQQWRTNQEKLKLELYDRRLRTYEEIRKILGRIIREGKVTERKLLEFRQSVFEADFLFDEEIINYIDEIYKKGLELHYKKEDFECSYSDAKSELAEEARTLFKWFTEQPVQAKKIFKRYLNIRV